MSGKLEMHLGKYGNEKSFWQNRRVVVTGHTGFKGAWLSLWLESLGAKVFGFSLPQVSESKIFQRTSVDKLITSTFGDICHSEEVKSFFEMADPDIVFHCAAQALVLESYDDPVTTFNTNVTGTVNVLQAAISAKKRVAIVNVTSDKCYENDERGKAFNEGDRLGGKDPYSSSKACAELVTKAYQHILRQNGSFSKVGLASVRAGNVIGGGDMSAKRLVPDIFRAHSTGNTLFIRNPRAVRPWQHVLDPLNAYILLAQSLYNEPERFSESWNIGPNISENYPVSFIVEKIRERLAFSVEFGPESESEAEASLLCLDSTKIKEALNWENRIGIDLALNATVDWEEASFRNSDMTEFTFSQIYEFAH